MINILASAIIVIVALSPAVAMATGRADRGISANERELDAGHDRPYGC